MTQNNEHQELMAAADVEELFPNAWFACIAKTYYVWSFGDSRHQSLLGLDLALRSWLELGKPPSLTIENVKLLAQEAYTAHNEGRAQSDPYTTLSRELERLDNRHGLATEPKDAHTWIMTCNPKAVRVAEFTGLRHPESIYLWCEELKTVTTTINDAHIAEVCLAKASEKLGVPESMLNVFIEVNNKPGALDARPQGK